MPGKATKPQTNFTAGEISPRVRARHDLSKYHNALELQENAVTLVHGGSSRRSGTRWVAKTRFQNRVAKFVEFKFDPDQQYTLEFGHRYIRFYRDRGQVTTTYAITAIDQSLDKVSIAGDQTLYMAAGDTFDISGSTGNNATYTIASVTFGTTTDIIVVELLPDSTADGSVKIPLTIPTIYDEADLTKLRYTQSGDILFFTHPLLQPRELRRTAGDDTLPATWQFTEFDYTDGPYLNVNITATTIDPSGTTGAITLTASTAIFATTDQDSADSPHGRLVRLQYGNASGVAEITGFTNATLVNATVIVTLPAATPTAVWRLGAWSDTTGWPEVVRFHQQRLYMQKLQKIYASVVGAFDEFTPSKLLDNGVLDTHGFVYALDDDRLNTGREIISETEGLLFLTNDGVFLGGAEGGPKKPITPDTFQVHRQTTQGHHPTVRAHQVGGLVLYVSTSGRILRELLFRFEIDKFKAPDITRLAEHITVGGIIDTAYQEEPDSILWLARNDGVLLGGTYEPQEQVLGFHRHKLGGKLLGADQPKIEAIAVIRDSDEDIVWLMVKRTINGVTVRSVEYIHPQFDVDDDVEDAFFIDAGATFDSRVSITAISNTNPVVITAAGHGLSNGDTVKIRAVEGFKKLATDKRSALDYRSFTVTGVSGATFQLQNENGTTYGVYEGGGKAAKEVTEISNLKYLQGEKLTILADGSTHHDIGPVDSAGKITLPQKASIVHAGLPYKHVQFSMPLVPEIQGVDSKAVLKKTFKAYV